MTTVNDLVDEARAATGLDDLGSAHFMGPLECWVRDLDDPVLSNRGREFLGRVAGSNLRNRLQIVDYLRRHPEISDVELPPVVLIAGFARSGTTLLHNLLSCHPRTRALQRWELVRPIPAPTAATWRTDPRRAEVQASVDALRGTDLEHLHWVNAHEPEECPWGFYDCTGLLGRGAGSVMRRWWGHLHEHHSPTTFWEYRRLIQLLLWKNPPPAGSVLVLKSPLTTPSLAQFAEAFPDARFVFTHRDPFRVVASMNAVVDAIASPLCVPGTRLGADDGRSERGALRTVAAAAAAMETFAATHPDRITHVHYSDLMADPVGMVTSTFARLGIDVGEDAGDRVEAFLADQRAGRSAPPAAYEHTYAVDDVWSVPAVASYCDTFRVQRESQRLTEPLPTTRSGHVPDGQERKTNV
ncbi:MAG: hypothetical protein QOI95_4420 [Acidimicrobiaceae bacterium]|jgi:hypothetical protein